jgi:hypothetical protein
MVAFMVLRRLWLVLGIAGFFAGLALFLSAPVPILAHLGLVIAIALPVIAFYRLMRPAIGNRQCPVRPDWT